MKLRTILLGLSALFIAVAAAYFSVTGLSKLFAGASTAVILMASSLEFGKLISAGFLYNYWNKINKFLRTYLLIGVGVLILITSAGIYGFLTSAYQITADQLSIMDKQTEVVELKKNRFQEQLDGYISERTQLNQSISELSKGLSNNVIQYTDSQGRLVTTTSSANRKSFETQLNDAKTQRDLISSKIEVLTDSVTNLDVQIIELQSGNELAAEVGPLKYLSEITGKPMNVIVNWFALLIIFVFDPLAVTLVIAFNTALKVDKGEKETDEVETKPFNDKPLDGELAEVMDSMLYSKVGNEPTKERFEKPEKEIWDTVEDLKKKSKLDSDISDSDFDDEPTALANSEYRLNDFSEKDVETILDAVQNPPEPTEELKEAVQRYNEYTEEDKKDKSLIDIKKLVSNLKRDYTRRAIDTDGDGVIDGYDTDGDGLIDDFSPKSSSRWRYAINRKPYYARPDFDWRNVSSWINNQNAVNYYLTYIVNNRYPNNFESKVY